MKIEIGESLMLSYLKHIKKCRFYQTNWKTSSGWGIDENSNDKLLFAYDNIIKHSEFSEIFKQSKLEQLIKQSEIDVIGWDGNDKIYAADIAFHEAGLNYGSKIETKNRVFKKLLRSYLTLLAYFPDKKYELVFASPKVHNTTEDIIKDYFKVLNNDFSKENVTFKYISNDIFRDEIFIPVINETKMDSDTNELFMRAIKLSNLFEIPSNKIGDISESKMVATKQAKATSEEVLSKSDAMFMINKKYSLCLNSSNTVFSNINNSNPVWWFQPNNDKFNNDFHLLLNDQNRKILYYFYIKGGSIKNPEIQFRQRNGKSQASISHIEIKVRDGNFTDILGKGFKFREYLKAEIKY